MNEEFNKPIELEFDTIQQKEQRGLYLPIEYWNELRRLAEKDGRSRNNYIEQIIKLHLSQTEIK